MSVDPGVLTIMLQMNTPVSDGRGGQNEAWSTVQTLTGHLRNRKPAPFVFGNTGAGETVERSRLMVFNRSSAPVIGANWGLYRFLLPDGSVLKVRGVDVYERTVQVDVETTL